jgi:hypothetical protein
MLRQLGERKNETNSGRDGERDASRAVGDKVKFLITRGALRDCKQRWHTNENEKKFNIKAGRVQ